MENKFKILEICVSLDGGGIDRYLYNYCRRINDLHFDFVIVDKGKVKGILEKDFEDRGSKIFKVPRITSGILKNFRAMYHIMKNGGYDAVHVHLGVNSALALLAAYLCGIKVRIVHAHIANKPISKKEALAKKLLLPLTKRMATTLAACGIDAAKWMWGIKAYEKGKVTIHNNAIETPLYKFSPEIRKDVRNKLGIGETTFVVGHVGRISMQKNQERLVSVFSEISKLQPDSKLLVIGRGSEKDMESLISKSKELGVYEKIDFMGVRNDVPMLLNAMDVFVFPSLFEGLPFTLIETQCNGLPSISSTDVSPYVKISKSLIFLSLDESDAVWAAKSVEFAKKGHLAESCQEVIDAGYDLDKQAVALRDFYINRINVK